MRDEDRAGSLDQLDRLKDRPTPELDSSAAWRRLHARVRVTPQVGGGWVGWLRAPAGRVALAGALLIMVAAALWLVPGGDLLPGGEPVSPGTAGAIAGAEPPVDPGREPVDASREMILLAEPESTPLVAAADLGPVPGADGYTLEFRLVRGYRGGRPDDAIDEAVLGAGGASLRADLDPTLRALHPEQEHAIIGHWSGELSAAAAEVRLSAAYDLRFGLARDDDGLRLLNVQLQGVEPPLVAQEMLLSPGQLYVFGVRGSAQGASDLVLAVRLRAAMPAPSEQD